MLEFDPLIAIFKLLPRDELLRVASHYRRVAEHLERSAGEDPAAVAERQCYAAHKTRFETAGSTAMELAAAGVPDPVAGAAARHGLEARAVAVAFQQAKARARNSARLARDVRIMRLARQGRTNAAIARELRCAEDTVSRCIRRALTPRWDNVAGRELEAPIGGWPVEWQGSAREDPVR
jgi:hypothetical protein